VLKPNERAIN